MIKIDITGPAGSGKTRVARLVLQALKLAGIKVSYVSTDETELNVGHVDVIVVESTTRSAPHTADYTDDQFDYLIGKTESAAYELVQDSDFVARVVSRNFIPMVATRDYRADRVNLSIVNNVVVAWAIN